MNNTLNKQEVKIKWLKDIFNEMKIFGICMEKWYNWYVICIAVMPLYLTATNISDSTIEVYWNIQFS